MIVREKRGNGESAHLDVDVRGAASRRDGDDRCNEERCVRFSA